jgi:hypothetical protein
MLSRTCLCKEDVTKMSSIHVFPNVFFCTSYFIDLDVNLLQMQVRCCKANHTTNIAHHSEKLVMGLFN